VTAEELAALHPRLFHVTSPGAWPLIERHGLLSTEALLDLFEVEDTRRQSLLGQRRPAEVPIAHERHGTAVLNDNLPLSARALERCLDDGLSPADWLRLLNARAFFWAHEDGLARLLSARMNRGRRRAVLVFDTLALVADNAARVELCPSNSGATIRKAARRGLATFTPLSAMGYREWRARRGGRDRILEVVVRGGVPKAARYLIERREVGDT
jgi:hypothetical protein